MKKLFVLVILLVTFLCLDLVFGFQEKDGNIKIIKLAKETSFTNSDDSNIILENIKKENDVRKLLEKIEEGRVKKDNVSKLNIKKVDSVNVYCFYKLIYSMENSKWTIEETKDIESLGHVTKNLNKDKSIYYQIIVKAYNMSDAYIEGCPEIYRKINMGY